MSRYFFQGEVDPFAEEVFGRIFWYRPSERVQQRVMDNPDLVVKDSDGGRMSGDDFWYAAGDLAWDDSRVGRRAMNLDKLFEPAVNS